MTTIWEPHQEAVWHMLAGPRSSGTDKRKALTVAGAFWTDCIQPYIKNQTSMFLIAGFVQMSRRLQKATAAGCVPCECAHRLRRLGAGATGTGTFSFLVLAGSAWYYLDAGAMLDNSCWHTCVFDTGFMQMSSRCSNKLAIVAGQIMGS